MKTKKQFSYYKLLKKIKKRHIIHSILNWSIYNIYPYNKIGKNIYLRGISKKNKVAITFDDGPSCYTLEILKILKKYNAKATFFVLGYKIKGKENIIKQIKKQGSEIGNHSYSHESLVLNKKQKIINEIIFTDKELSKLNIKTSLLRPPHGNMGYSLNKISKQLRKKVILWDVDPIDWKLRDPKKTVKSILDKTKNGSIIDLHEHSEGVGNNFYICRILNGIIPKLQKQGYQLVTVSDLLDGN